MMCLLKNLILSLKCSKPFDSFHSPASVSKIVYTDTHVTLIGAALFYGEYIESLTFLGTPAVSLPVFFYSGKHVGMQKHESNIFIGITLKLICRNIPSK